MKKMISFLFTILICQTASAQTVMSESELFGYWKAISVSAHRNPRCALFTWRSQIRMHSKILTLSFHPTLQDAYACPK